MRIAVWASLGLTLLGACGGGDDGDGGTGPAVATTVTIASSATGDFTTLGQTRQLTATVRDQNNNVMSGAPVSWTTSAASVVSLPATTTGSSITVTAEGDGDATITAKSGNATGQVALHVATGGGGGATVTAGSTSNTFSPSTVTIAKGNAVTWKFGGRAHDVTFDTQGAPADIGATTDANVDRAFPNAGTYDYHCSIHGAGMSGTVVVQ